MAEIIEITDFSDERLDIYSRLSENQLAHYFEPENGLFIAESPKVIERALDAGYVPFSLLLERKHIDGEAREIVQRCKDIPVFTSDPSVLSKLTGFNLTRGALCAMIRKDLPSVEKICRGINRVAVLENVVNPTNVGAIFRSAAALEVGAVLLTRSCADPLYRRASRVSMGTVFQIPWTCLDGDSGEWLDSLSSLGFKTAAMALTDESVSIDNRAVKSEERLAVILGAEGDGLAPQTIVGCDYTVRIPMAQGIDSLNVAAASAVAFWELGRMR